MPRRATLREIGKTLRVSHGSAHSLIRLAIRAAFKAARKLPRYDGGHPGPWRARRTPVATAPPANVPPARRRRRLRSAV